MDLVEISVVAEKDVYKIELVGGLDARSSIVLDQALEKAAISKPHPVYIDSQKLTYISSAGLGAIISHLHQYHTHTISLTVLNVPYIVQTICETVGFNKLVHIAELPAENRQSCKNPIACHMSSDGDNT
jgi:anti-sigma B factor antagonist